MQTLTPITPLNKITMLFILVPIHHQITPHIIHLPPSPPHNQGIHNGSSVTAKLTGLTALLIKSITV